MRLTLPRMLYILGALAWLMLLWPNQVTIFMAACLSCLTLPFYHFLRLKALQFRRRLGAKKQLGRLERYALSASRHFPILVYICMLLFSFLIPVAALVYLVAPQAMAGLGRLRELQANNFELPPEWLEYVHHIQAYINDYPRLKKIIDDATTNLDTMFTDAVSILVSRSFDFVGGTMTALWTIFLFFTLAIIFSVYSTLLGKITCRVLHIPYDLLSHFVLVAHKALKAIMLGIVFVALVQGALCGVAFAVAGISQPAFWGMLATLVAPIPMVGTALVWLPLCISLWFSGHAMSAVMLGLWGAIVVAGIDNVLRPLFLRQGINAPFFVLILAMLCGLNAFGAVGLIAGPILLAIAIQCVDEGNFYYRRLV